MYLFEVTRDTVDRHADRLGDGLQVERHKC
jgi:hypothetical protein